jgi:hypothetical protein
VNGPDEGGPGLVVEDDYDAGDLVPVDDGVNGPDEGGPGLVVEDDDDAGGWQLGQR